MPDLSGNRKLQNVCHELGWTESILHPPSSIHLQYTEKDIVYATNIGCSFKCFEQRIYVEIKSEEASRLKALSYIPTTNLCVCVYRLTKMWSQINKC